MIHPAVMLVSAEVVATMRGISREAVYALAEETRLTAHGPAGGSLLWIFNVSTRESGDRELRFWSTELANPLAVQCLTIDQVVARVVPARVALPGQFPGLSFWQAGDLLRVSRASLLELRPHLAPEDHRGCLYVRAETLRNFLKRRWLFAGHATPLQTKFL